MNDRFTILGGLLVVILGAGAVTTRAQSLLPASRLRPVTAPVRDAGVLHLATGTWTRKANYAALGADIVYNNTCTTGFYSPLSGDTYVDEGRVPSPSSPTNTSSRPGCATNYTIDGFQIAYCTDQVSIPSYEVAFFQSYISCASVIGVTPTGSFSLAGLPAAPLHGSGACWTVSIDLSGGLSFTMLADGDGSYQSPDGSNLFGWSIGTTAPGTGTGPMIAGDTSVCSRFDGTRWDNGPGLAWPANLAEPGTGMSTLSQFRIEGGPTPPGCYWGGPPVWSFLLELYADACSAPPGQGFCFGDGSGTACPCGNASAPASESGCLHSGGVGGKLAMGGEPSLSHDTVVLLGTQMPASSSALYFQGTQQQNSGLGTVFGDGLRCAGGSSVRLGSAANSGIGVSSYPLPGQAHVSTAGFVMVPGLRTYQVWYRNSATFCTSAAFNLTNGWEVVWGP